MEPWPCLTCQPTTEPSAPPVCVITNHLARYRDPETGLPYHNAHAYREIRRLTRGEYRWSQLLGAWSGGGNSAAKGVPARFLDPTAKGPKQVAEEKRLAQEEEDKKKREAAAAEEEEARKKVEEDEKEKGKGKEAADQNRAVDGGKEGADGEVKAPDVTTAAAVETTPSAAPTSGSEAKPEVQQKVQPEAPPEPASKQEQQEQQAALA